jgi:hypothetical protein
MMSRAHKSRPSFLGPDSLPAWILVGLVLFNIGVFWIFAEDEYLPEWVNAVVIGAWTFEPMLLAIWTALSPGALIIRLSLAVPSLALLIAAQAIAPGGFKDIELYEFKIMTIAGSVMFAADLILMLILRWFFGWRLEPPGLAELQPAPRFQFGIKYLIILLTLCAVVLGILSDPVFKPPPEPNFAFIMFGPEFFLHIVMVGGTTILFALLPLAAIPLMLLSAQRSKRAFAWTLGTWGVMTVLIAAVWLALGEENVLPFGLLVQLGAAVLGFAAAVPLRLAGYRLKTSR